MFGVLSVADFFWLVVLLLSLCIEAGTAQLVSIWFAFGAAGAIIAAQMGASGCIQMAVCLFIAAILILLTRPLARNLARKSPEKTNTDRIIGERAIVTETIDNDKGTGQIRIMGQTWTARSISPEILFQKGSEVVIHEIAGVKAIVRPAESK